MKTIKFILMLIAGLTFTFSSCNDDDDKQEQEQFSGLSSPYLICATRNPGGVGFDFEYHGEKGGANNLDELTVEDFTYDVMIRTIKGEKPDGSLGGMPHIALADNAEAVNYSAIDETMTGYTKFQGLIKAGLAAFSFSKDDAGFNLSGLETGNTGKPLMSAINAQYQKLVIGDKWKAPAKNDTEGDEPIFIIKTSEGKWAKLIVTDFPADPAPTATGYISMEWELIE